ncbi:MAG: ATP-binding cassette domain-containing protein [Streptosporangiales bacterium]|nr:ATP-binding cassette domain-containing protein [Streptosporangiales bacterium]
MVRPTEPRSRRFPPTVTVPDTTAATEIAIRISGLKHQQGPYPVFTGLDLAVPAGSVFALIGPGGSGKSTLLRMIAGRTTPDAGTVEVADGTDEVAAALDGPSASNLSVTAWLCSADRADRRAPADTRDARVARALELTGLAEVSLRRVAELNRGRLRRLRLAAAVVRPRAVLLLDDPFDGLDADGRARLTALVRGLTADAVTVVLATHDDTGLDGLATHAALLRDGRVTDAGTLEELSLTAPSRVRVRTPDLALAHGVLAGLGVSDVRSAGGEIVCDPGGATVDRICRALALAGVRIMGLARL